MNLFKEFESFKEGIEELVEISQAVSIAFSEEDSLPETAEDATIYLLKNVMDDIPNPYSENYPNAVAISVNANEVGYKCPGSSISFGWITFVDKETNELKYSFRITVFTRDEEFAKKTPTIKNAIAHEWTSTTRKNKW